MNKKSIIIGLAIFITVFIIGAVSFPRFMSSDDVAAAELESTNQATFANSPAVQTGGGIVSAEGVITPLRHANLSFMMGGQVAEIVATEGTVVAAGDPILRLEAAGLELNLQQARAGMTSAEAALAAAQAQMQLAQAQVNTAEIGVSSAQAQLNLVKAGPRAEEIAASEKSLVAAESGVAQAAGNRDATLNISDAQIRAAEANVAAEAANLRAIQDTYDDIIDACFETPDGKEVCPLYGTVEENTRAQLEIAQLQYNAAQEGLNALNAGPTGAQQRAAGGAVSLAVASRGLAQAQLDLLLAGATPEQIKQAEVGVEQAELGVAQAQTAVTLAEAAIAQAEAGVVQAQATIDTAQKALDRMTLTAPFPGTVASIMVDEGELATSGMPVVALADLDGWLVETTDLTELDVVAIALGSNVDVRIDAIDDELITGTVTEIAAVSTLTRGDVTYAVTVQLEPTSLPLRWGMTAFVDVNSGQ